MLIKILTLLVICIGLNNVQAGLSELNRIAANMRSVQGGRSSMISHDSTDICDRYDVDGCSIPGGLPYFDKKTFTPSCNRHDICYHCGVSYGHNKTLCDTLFFTNMMGACENWFMSHVSLPIKHQIVEIFREHSSDFNSVADRYLNDITVRARTIDDFWMHANELQEHILYLWGHILEYYLGQMDSDGTRQSFLISMLVAKSNIPRSDIVKLVKFAEPLMRCKLHAKEYWLAVAIFGTSSYHTTPEFYCQEEFVPECLKLIS